MTDRDVKGALLTDGENSIFFHPPQRYPDGGAYHHQVDLVGGPFQGSIDATTYVEIKALEMFQIQVAAIYKTLRGSAKIASYENLNVSLEGDGRGHIEVRVEAIAGPQMETRLRFNFSVHQTQLPAFIEAVQAFLASDTH